MSSTRIIRAPVPSSAQVATGNQETVRNETRPAPGSSVQVSVQDATSTALEKSGFESHTGRDVLLNEGTTQTSPTADRTRSGIYRSLRSSSTETKDPGASADSTSSKTEGRLRGQRALSLLSGGKELLANESTNDTQGTSEKKQSTPLSSEKKLLAKKKKSTHLAKKKMILGKKQTHTTAKQNSTTKTPRRTGESSTQGMQKSENIGTTKTDSTTPRKTENAQFQQTDPAASQRSGSAVQTSLQRETGRGGRESTLGAMASQQSQSSSVQTEATRSRAQQIATTGASVGGNSGTDTGTGTTGSASTASLGGLAEKQSAAALMLGANGAAADRAGFAGAGKSDGTGGSPGTLASPNASSPLAQGAALGQATDVSGKSAMLGQSLASATSGAGSLRADTPLAQQVAHTSMAGSMNSAQMSEGANRLLSLQSLLLQGAKEGSGTKETESSKETSSPRQEFREMVKQWANAKEMAVLFNLQATVMPNDVSAVAWKIATLAQQGALPKSELMALLSKLLKTPGNRKKLERIKNLLIKKGLVSAGVSADSLELIAAMIAMYLAKKGDIEADDLLEELFGLPSRNLDLIVPDEGGSFHEEGREEQNHQEHREGLKFEKSKT